MTTSRFERFLPIAGILAGLLFVATGFLPEPPGVDASPASRVAWYADHKTMVMVAAFAGGYFAVLMLFFAAAIRKTLRSGEPGESTYSTVALAGAITVGITSAVGVLQELAVVEAADKGQTAVVTTMAFLGDFSWLPLMVGLSVLYLATGLGGLRTATLPRWLAIVTVVLGVLALLGPTGVAVYFATPLWLIATGVVLYRRDSVPAATAGVPGRTSYAATAG